MVLGEKFVLKCHFDGLPKVSDFELVKEELGPLQDGEVLFQAEYISVDPYQRVYVGGIPNRPITMIGSAVAKILESKDPSFPVGSRVITYAGWVKIGKVNPSKENAMSKATGRLPSIMLAPDIGKLSPSILLGICGMPGATAYFGLLDLCQPKQGETVVVNGAAGAVGSVVGQIAKIKGCKVMGFAGSEQKCKFLKDDLGFDWVFNYKTQGFSMEKSLSKAEKGIDCFFDNVGGNDSSKVLMQMNHRGRIAVCGAISTYNNKSPDEAKAIAVQGLMVSKQLKMEGFLVHRWRDQYNECLAQLVDWVKAGKLNTKETVISGFEKTPEAFIGLFTGENIGKMVVKA